MVPSPFLLLSNAALMCGQYPVTSYIYENDYLCYLNEHFLFVARLNNNIFADELLENSK